MPAAPNTCPACGEHVTCCTCPKESRHRNAAVFDHLVWVLSVDSDTDEGRGSISKHYYANRKAAEVAGRRAGVFGRDLEPSTENPRIVWFEDKLYLLGAAITATIPESPATLKERALAKLTPEERKALGY